MKKVLMICLVLNLLTAVSYGAGRYKGDLNGDGRVDIADMGYLARTIKSGSNDTSCDLNLSGKVDKGDLHTLADIILSGNLIEDEDGFNAGIGAWEDDGVDYGGSLRSTSVTRSGDKTYLDLRNPRNEGNDRYSMGLYATDEVELISGLLVNIDLPHELAFDQEKVVELEESLLKSHDIFGKIRLEISDNVWDMHKLRFIIFSLDLSPISSVDGTLARIHYSCGQTYDQVVFRDCQLLMTNSEDIVTLSEYWLPSFKWFSTDISSIFLDETEIELEEGDVVVLKATVEPSDATDQSLKWTSSDNTVATVSAEGEVTGVKTGEAVITVTASNGISASCKIKVSQISGIESITNEDVIIEVEAGKIKIKGINPGTVVTVFDIAGSNIMNKIADLDLCSIELNKKGIYIIKIGNKSVKVFV